MARTIDSPIVLPSNLARAGAAIRSDTSATRQAGVDYIARSLNTLWDQHRGQLVSDYLHEGIATTAAQVAYYRAPTWGRGSLTETAECYAFIDVTGVPDAVKTFSLTFGCGGNTATYLTLTDPGAAQWVQTSSDLTIPDDGTIQTITVLHGGTLAATCYGVAVIYNRDRATADALASTAQYYTGTSFAPVDSGIVDDEYPLSSALLYTMHDSARELYRRTGPAITSAFPANPLTAGNAPGYTSLRVPSGVTQLYVQVYGINMLCDVQTQRERQILHLPWGTAGWSGVRTLDVSGLGTVDLRVYPRAGAGSVSAISAYWGDRRLT